MIQKNIVQIETMESMGTGIMYPCNVRGALYDYRMQYFIVLTNSHVLSTIGIMGNNQEYKHQIIVRFYDDMQNEVPQSQIKSIQVYNAGNHMENKDDIAALLLVVNGTVPITLEKKIAAGPVENRSTLYMEGYPGVLLEDEVSSRIQLQGVEKTVFPPNEAVGIYQITDDYHWYNNFQDRQLLQGMSGGLVYQVQGEEVYLLGMAQSVSDIHIGENPFKLMYYIKMKYILKHLREADCIIFSKEDKDSLNIEWIYGQKMNSNKKNTLLLLGGSGAGKSSFAKDFAYHGNEICSTNDGQTTRTKVIYEYAITEEHPRAEVKFLTQEEFVEQMIKRLGHRPAILVMKQLFRLSPRSVQDEKNFLENCHRLLLKLQDNRKNQRYKTIIGDLNAVLQNGMDAKSTLRCYENLIQILWENFPLDWIKYLIDSNLLWELKVNYKKSGMILINGVQIERKPEELDASLSENESKVASAVRDFLESNADNEPDDFAVFQEEIIQQFVKDNFIKQNEAGRIAIRLDENFEKIYTDELLYCEGFFDIKEFQSLLPSEYKHQFYKKMKEKKDSCNIFQIDSEILEEEKNNGKSGQRIIVNIHNGIKEWYRAVHAVIKEQLLQHYDGMNENNLQLTFDLKQINQEKRKLLQQCLQVTAWGSLTGIINFVRIYDMVSDEYAYVLAELGIKTLQLVDTCGLDHIEYYDKQKLKNILYENLYYYNGNKMVRLSDISVLYVKKLDSGKPDELRTVLPCVREVFPASPVYCVFTGIDIFYRTSEEIAAISWKRDSENMPKAVQYIFSEKGKESICSEQGEKRNILDQNMYIVMCNNLIPYCGEKQLVRTNYQFYKNNTTYIRKLLASISMKEYSSLEVIETKLIDKICSKIGQIDRNKEIQDKTSEWNRQLKDRELTSDEEYRFIQAVEVLVKEIFADASLESHDFRYNTKQADIVSFCKRNTMGFYCTYRHQLNQRFHEAY